jgi:NAD(P)-dependent dehydrogenase (short-subunit alcohol dehydrogenase family)
MKNIIVITGASSGFGALTARALAKAGHIVYASMRETKTRNAPQVKELEKYAAEHSVDLRPIELDVSSQESCNAAIQEIIARNGRLDVVIHNAGHMVFGPARFPTPTSPRSQKPLWMSSIRHSGGGPSACTLTQRMMVPRL